MPDEPSSLRLYRLIVDLAISRPLQFYSEVAQDARHTLRELYGVVDTIAHEYSTGGRAAARTPLGSVSK